MNKSNMFLLGIILLLVLITGGIVGWMAIVGNNQQSDGQADSPVSHYNNNFNNDDDSGSQLFDDDYEKFYDPKKVIVYPVTKDPILSNINTGNINDKRMVRVLVNLYVTDSKFIKDDLTPRNTEVIDAIYTILRSKTPDDYAKPEIKKVIRQELLKDLSRRFRTNCIVDAYFDEFVTQ